jgi:hypothetical protein
VELRVRTVIGKLAIAILVQSFVCTSCGEPQQLSGKDVKIAAGDLRTLAFATARMTELFERGAITQIFYRNQSELLLEKVSDTAEQLEGRAERPSEEPDRLKLTNLTRRLQDELERIQHGERTSVEVLNELGKVATAIENELKDK